MTGQAVPEMLSSYVDVAVQALTPRQDRLERTILDVLRCGGTRSQLRDLVNAFADYVRMCGVPVNRAEAMVRALGTRATPYMESDGSAAVGDSASDRIAMMVRWCSVRYQRAD